jgi:hypothetical protein
MPLISHCELPLSILEAKFELHFTNNLLFPSPGGRFEFLPVTIQSAGVVITAVLRLTATVGIVLELPEPLPSLSLFGDSASAGGGIVAQVFADIAELVMNVSTAGDGDPCDLGMVAEYSFNIGAGAGASLTLNTHTWGPDVTTSTPIYYTTLLSMCATKPTSSVTAMTAAAASSTAVHIFAKNALAMTTLTTTQTYGAVACKSPGLINCPGSLQTTLKSTSTVTFVVSVPPGSTAAQPTLTQNSVPTTIAFGSEARTLPVMSGSPTSYVPSPSSTVHIPGPLPTGPSLQNFVQGTTRGVSKKIILGVSLGFGVPVIAATCCW